jgi:hypothetical protein
MTPEEEVISFLAINKTDSIPIWEDIFIHYQAIHS